MLFKQTYLKGSYTVHLEKYSDERGFFSRYWCKNEYSELGLSKDINQINNSFNIKKGTLRGLHFQYPPKSEVKIVRCISGAIWDVIVDIRLNSLTYGRYFGVELSSENRTMLYVPEGFAHGFISLVDNSEILYLSSQFYDSKSEGGLRWNDPFHGIKWPLDPSFISKKDSDIKDWEDSSSVQK